MNEGLKMQLLQGILILCAMTTMSASAAALTITSHLMGREFGYHITQAPHCNSDLLASGVIINAGFETGASATWNPPPESHIERVCITITDAENFSERKTANQISTNPLCVIGIAPASLYNMQAFRLESTPECF